MVKHLSDLLIIMYNLLNFHSTIKLMINAVLEHSKFTASKDTHEVYIAFDIILYMIL